MRARSKRSRLVVLLATLAVSCPVLAGENPAEVGLWQSPQPWPVVAIHASLLPNGKVLFWQTANGGLFQPGFQETTAYLWDPVTDTVETVVDIAHNDLFCSGHASLADGRQMVIG